jgi:hypothetical protein
MLPVVSSAVFLSVCHSLIAVGFGSSFQFLSRGFSFRHDGGEGGRWKREKEEEGGRRRKKEEEGGRRRKKEEEGGRREKKRKSTRC